MASRILVYIFRAICMLVSIPVHESAHALASALQGDPTARNCGRLTMNPAAHFDLWGCLCLIFFGVGWAKPVPVNPNNYQNPKRGMVLTALAGPASNVLLAYAAVIFYKLIWYLAPAVTLWEFTATLMMHLASMNIALAAVNLLPIPPFDGSRLFTAVLPTGLYFRIMQNRQWIFIVVLVLLFLGILDGPILLIRNGLWDFMDFSSRFVDKILYTAVVGTAV